jgi:hypothetical protein
MTLKTHGLECKTGMLKADRGNHSIRIPPGLFDRDDMNNWKGRGPLREQGDAIRAPGHFEGKGVAAKGDRGQSNKKTLDAAQYFSRGATSAYMTGFWSFSSEWWVGKIDNGNC